jgi:hypothetical protein
MYYFEFYSSITIIINNIRLRAVYWSKKIDTIRYKIIYLFEKFFRPYRSNTCIVKYMCTLPVYIFFAFFGCSWHASGFELEERNCLLPSNVIAWVSLLVEGFTTIHTNTIKMFNTTSGIVYPCSRIAINFIMKWLRYLKVISLETEVGITSRRNKWANMDP